MKRREVNTGSNSVRVIRGIVYKGGKGEDSDKEGVSISGGYLVKRGRLV